MWDLQSWTDEANFVADVAVALFAVSLTFSGQLSYTELEVFPTMFLYRWAFCLHDRLCLASLFFDAFNFLSLVLLGAFWYYRGELRSRLPVGTLGFMAYLITGAFFGLLPWFVYWYMHLIVGVR